MLINIAIKQEFETYLQQHPETQKIILEVLEENPDMVEDLTHKIEVKLESLKIEDVTVKKKNKWTRFAEDYSKNIEGLGETIRKNNEEFRENFQI